MEIPGEEGWAASAGGTPGANTASHPVSRPGGRWLWEWGGQKGRVRYLVGWEQTVKNTLKFRLWATEARYFSHSVDMSKAKQTS